MEILLELQNFFIRIIEWMEMHPVISAGLFTIFGTILSAIIDIRKQVIKIKSNIITRVTQRIKANKNSGINAAITNSPGAKIEAHVSGSEPRPATEEEALGRPAIKRGITLPQLSGNAEFICHEVKVLFERNGATFERENDYASAESYKVNGQRQPSATLYIGVFNPIIDLLEKVDEKVTAANLKQEISKLKSWSLDGHSAESLDEIIINIERIMFQFFQNRI